MSRATGNRAHEVVFVAHDVGGLGGLERQTARLVDGLLKEGFKVTVIARTCTPGPCAGLRFVRVRVPRRPFTIAYLAFAIVATVRAARRGNALLHTTAPSWRTGPTLRACITAIAPPVSRWGNQAPEGPTVPISLTLPSRAEVGWDVPIDVKREREDL